MGTITFEIVWHYLLELNIHSIQQFTPTYTPKRHRGTLNSRQGCAGASLHQFKRAVDVQLSPVPHSETLVALKWPWWKYLHDGNRQTLQAGLFTLESQLLNIYQHTTDFRKALTSSYWLTEMFLEVLFLICQNRNHPNAIQG